jgi:hypothetical protein
MAEFSKEYITLQGWTIIPDFSIHLEFKKLKEGEMKQVICEGFGFNAILKEDNTCKLLYSSGEVKTYDELLVKE